MSDFSLTLVLRFKTSKKIFNDMAKVSIKSEKITPFGGIFIQKNSCKDTTFFSIPQIFSADLFENSGKTIIFAPDNFTNKIMKISNISIFFNHLIFYKSMNKSLISMAAVLFAALMTTVLTSCSKDDDEPKKAEFTKAVVKYTVTSDAATLGLYKVNVYGTDVDGNDFVETMSNPSYTKTVEIPVSKLPCTVELRTVATPLEDKAATEDFDVSIDRNLDVMTLRSDNTVVDDKEVNYNSWATQVAAGTSLSEYAKSHLNNHPKLVIYIDANGSVSIKQ